MKISGPGPRVAFVVPVGRLDVLASRRGYLGVLSVIRDLKLLGFDVVHKLVDVLVGSLLIVSIKSFNNHLQNSIV